nr:ATP-dependent zinc metalloprotease FtsH [Anaerolineae bacterium]
MNSTRFRHGFVYLLIILAGTVIILGAFARREGKDILSLSEVAQHAQEGRIESIVVMQNDEMRITLSNNDTATSLKESGSTAPEQLLALGVSPEKISAIEWSNQKGTNWSGVLSALVYLLPVVIVLGGIYFMMRQTQGSNNQAISFGKSRARMFTGDQPTVTFDDVAGCDESKEELREVVEFLREPAKFIQLGARIPKGVLLVGPPGTGKTLLAKATSGEAGVPFFSISGSEFVEMFVGVGASRVRDLFEQAKRHSPCIVFVDEIDAVGRQRGAGLGGSHDEREQTLNQILVEMDGFDTDTNVIVVAATNRPDILDPALLRPGRFDRRVVLDRPDVRGREGILKVHVRGKPLAADVDLGILARATPGFVGADIENMVNEAAILAARRNRKTIGMDEMQEAIERLIAGPERRSRLIRPEEKKITAFHEAGHAVVAHLLPFCDPVLKVTIIPRGMAGGYTMSLGEDMMFMSRSKFLDTIAMVLGGRVAEELVFNEVTTGASDDLERVTRIARNMVTRYGMSDRLGPMIYGQKEELVFLGREIGEQRDYSDAVAEEIDNEVRHIVSSAYECARNLLNEHRDKLELVAETLLEVETLDREVFEALMEGQMDVIEALLEKKAEIAKTLLEHADEAKAGQEDGDASTSLEYPTATAPA